MTIDKVPGHRIASISYSKDNLVCECGASMKAKDALDWTEHRAKVGAPRRTLSMNLRQRFERPV